MNALGRLSDANPIVDLLTTDDPARARTLAYQLEGLNSRRKFLTDQVYKSALSQIEQDSTLLQNQALVLSSSTWPAGVIGIAASRLVERYHKPAILITTAGEGVGRGSARSINGVDISKAISECSSLLLGFGGHPMAAGLSIEEEKINDFSLAVSCAVGNQGPLAPAALHIDGYITLEELSLEFADDIERLSPFGSGNPPLILAVSALKIIQVSQIGRDGDHLLIRVEDKTGLEKHVIWWGGAPYEGELPDEKFDLACTIRSSTYKGNRDVQIEWVDFRLVEDEINFAARKQTFEILDYRSEPYPLSALEGIILGEEVQIWAEADGKDKLRKNSYSAHSRRGLVHGKSLVIWTMPPGNDVLRDVLVDVGPERVYLFNVEPDTGNVEIFLKRLTGLIKYSMNKQNGEIEISKLAAATAQRDNTVQAGIDWLEARGVITIVSRKGEILQIEEISGQMKDNYDIYRKRLYTGLEETKSYYKFYKRVDSRVLLGLEDNSD
jgi:single-stranded-DNA-specific exonuclease